MKDIREIFYNLEKISDKWDPYFDVYMKHLSKFIDKSPTILEIGVQNGGSIDMWLEYFGPGTTVVGVDVVPECKQLKYPENVEIFIGDQADVNFWDTVLTKYNEFDIIIDDGGHTMQQQIVTLDKMFPALKEGGVFICEDTHTSYMPGWGGQYGNKATFMSYAQRLSDYMTKEYIPPGFISKKTQSIFGNSLTSMSFYNSMVVFEKEKQKEFKRVFSHDRKLPTNT